jgi:hypothetical protein
MVVMVFAWSASAQAATLSLDFSTSPTESGFAKNTGINYVDPDTMLNTGAGTWDVNLQGDSAPGASDGLKATYTNHGYTSSLTDRYIYGEANIAFQGGSSNMDDRTIAFISAGSASAGYAVSVHFTPGHIEGYKPGAYALYSVNVSNNDGQSHTYKWELDKQTGTLGLEFDGSFKGFITGTNKNWVGESQLYFGDGTGGSTHADTWNSWMIGSSATQSIIPEPSAIVLLFSGMLGLVCYAWRKRK